MNSGNPEYERYEGNNYMPPPPPPYSTPSQVEPAPVQQTIIVQSAPSNGIGTAGFVFAVVAIAICWIPIIGQFIGVFCWILGALLSFIGLFKAPRGLAIAGFIISFLGLIIGILLFIGGLGMMALFI